MLSDETMRRLMLAYDTGHLFDSSEFVIDAGRIVLIAKLIDRWMASNESNLRLLINHIIIIENTFGETGLYALYEYIGQFKECVPALLSVLFYMGKISRPSVYDVELLNKLEEMNNDR